MLFSYSLVKNQNYILEISSQPHFTNGFELSGPIRRASLRMNMPQNFSYLTNICCHQTVKNWSDAPSTINGRNQGETGTVARCLCDLI